MYFAVALLVTILVVIVSGFVALLVVAGNGHFGCNIEFVATSHRFLSIDCKVNQSFANSQKNRAENDEVPHRGRRPIHQSRGKAVPRRFA